MNIYENFQNMDVPLNNNQTNKNLYLNMSKHHYLNNKENFTNQCSHTNVEVKKHFPVRRQVSFNEIKNTSGFNNQSESLYDNSIWKTPSNENIGQQRASSNPSLTQDASSTQGAIGINCESRSNKIRYLPTSEVSLNGLAPANYENKLENKWHFGAVAENKVDRPDCKKQSTQSRLEPGSTECYDIRSWQWGGLFSGGGRKAYWDYLHSCANKCSGGASVKIPEKDWSNAYEILYDNAHYPLDANSSSYKIPRRPADPEKLRELVYA